MAAAISSTMGKKSVMFTCYTNLMVSPMAEAILRKMVEEMNVVSSWTISSAAVGPFNNGQTMDFRCSKILRERKMEYDHKVRQFELSDFTKYDVIFTITEDNLKVLKRKAPSNYTGQIKLLGVYDPEGKIYIEDPYVDNDDKGFYKCYDQCLRDCQAFLEESS